MKATFGFYSFIVLLVLIFSCTTNTDYTKNYKNSSIISFMLLQQCVDTMKNISHEINTKNYVLDLSSIRSLNKDGVDSFIQVKNSIMPTTHDDSTVLFKDGDLEDFYMKQSIIIKIDSIKDRNEKGILVKVRKIKSKNEIVEATIELDRHLEGYKVKTLIITN